MLAPTMGIVVVARLAASTAGVPVAKITLTLSPARSFAAFSKPTGRSAYLCSVVTFWPSTKPTSRRPSRNACKRLPVIGADGFPGQSAPIRGRPTLVCCASAIDGHAAAPPSNLKNSRRFTIALYPFWPKVRICDQSQDREGSRPGRATRTNRRCRRGDRIKSSFAAAYETVHGPSLQMPASKKLMAIGATADIRTRHGLARNDPNSSLSGVVYFRPFGSVVLRRPGRAA